MTNKLVVILNSLKVPKIKKILLYEMKFLVPNYSCLQNPWLGGYGPQIPVLSVLCPQLNLLKPPPRTKFVGTPLHWRQIIQWSPAVPSNTQSKQPSVRADCQLNKCVYRRTARKLSRGNCIWRFSSYRSANALFEHGHAVGFVYKVKDTLDF